MFELPNMRSYVLFLAVVIPCVRHIASSTPDIFVSAGVQVAKLHTSYKVVDLTVVTKTAAAYGIAVNKHDNKVYYSDLNLEKKTSTIFRVNDDGSGLETFYGCYDNCKIEALAISANGYLYWTDRGQQAISRLSLSSGSLHAETIVTGLDKPRGIVVFENHVYWTDWGKNPSVSRADLTGDNVVPLVTGKIKWPNGVAIDESSRVMYVIDSFYKSIQSYNLDGTNRRKVISDRTWPVNKKGKKVHGLSYTYSVAAYDGVIYWGSSVLYRLQRNKVYLSDIYSLDVTEDKPIQITESSLRMRIRGLAVKPI